MKPIIIAAALLALPTPAGAGPFSGPAKMKPVYDAYVRHGDGDKVMECIAETYGRGEPCWNVDRQCSLRLLRKCERGS
jgi:hypothetical protein